MFIRFMFLADNVSFDMTGKLSANGIFDNILSRSFPTMRPEMYLVVNVEGSFSEKGEHNISVEFRDEDDNRLQMWSQKIQLGDPTITHGNLRAGVILGIRNLTVNKQGQYQFVVFADDRFLGRFILTAQKITVKDAGEA